MQFILKFSIKLVFRLYKMNIYELNELMEKMNVGNLNKLKIYHLTHDGTRYESIIMYGFIGRFSHATVYVSSFFLCIQPLKPLNEKINKLFFLLLYLHKFSQFLAINITMENKNFIFCINLILK